MSILFNSLLLDMPKGLKAGYKYLREQQGQGIC